MLVVLILLFIASVVYSIEHHDYVVGIGWTAAVASLIFYYALIVFDFPGFVANIPLRQAIVRPSLIGFFSLVLVHILNGKVNKLITRTVDGFKIWTHKHFRPLSR